MGCTAGTNRRWTQMNADTLMGLSVVICVYRRASAVPDAVVGDAA
jgi:hypothetical protein